MLSVLLWKEYREHRIVWAALAFVAAASLLFLPFVMAPGGLDSHPEVRNVLRVLVVALAWTYGLICGAMLLAGEREVGTLPFLDGLPGLRWRLWLAKCLAGLVLVLAQIILLMIVATATHLFVSGIDVAWTLNALLWSGLYGFAWGMLFSSFGRNVMNMILLALAAQVGTFAVTSLVAGFLAALSNIASGATPSGDPTRFWGQVAAGVALLTIAPALAGSAFLFTRLDRGRLQPLRIVVRPTKQGSPGWGVLFWLTCLKAFGFALGVAIFALVIGFLIPILGVMVWPAATLFVGILCGATAFADEQQGPFRYLGDQRLPLLRFWFIKVGVRLVVALAAATIMTMPAYCLTLVNPQAISLNFAGLVMACGLVLFGTMGLVYGFCVGVLCGLLFRRLRASVVIALFVSLVLAAVWLPSLLAGGLHAWQALGPPILLLAATPLLLRPWAAGRIASWTTVKWLTPFVVLIGLWIVVGLWYRVLEIPNVPAKVDLAAFRATLPTEKENKAGELIRSACERFSDLSEKISFQHQLGMQPVTERAEKVLDRGWSGDDPKLAAWLDKMAAGEWKEMLKEASELPPGMVVDMRNMTFLDSDPVAVNSKEITVVLAERGLQRQAAGDDEAFVENFRVGLKLSLAMRRRASILDVIHGRINEALLLKGLDRWLEHLHGRPDLLHQTLDVLSQYADATANSDDDQDLMEDLAIMNSVKDPLPWLQYDLSVVNKGATTPNSDVQAEAQWVSMAWFAPWEHARQQRILRADFWGDEAQRRKAFWSNGSGPLSCFYYIRGKPNKLTNVALERAGILKLALRWYQADNGKPAETLDELVPKYLPSLPLDPYDGEPFRYRLSRGEEIEGSFDPNEVVKNGATPIRKIPPGQGVLWCVGDDKVDDGGHRQCPSFWREAVPGEDVIFLVPLAPKAK
jgi:hypothetical protein